MRLSLGCSSSLKDSRKGAWPWSTSTLYLVPFTTKGEVERAKGLACDSG